MASESSTIVVSDTPGRNHKT